MTLVTRIVVYCCLFHLLKYMHPKIIIYLFKDVSSCGFWVCYLLKAVLIHNFGSTLLMCELHDVHVMVFFFLNFFTTFFSPKFDMFDSGKGRLS